MHLCDSFKSQKQEKIEMNIFRFRKKFFEINERV